jgi:threonylcarbamoyladenosine tRNA methylthiotransferase MtaB
MANDNHLRGKKFSVIAMGCRVNRYEAESIASMLENRGAIFIRERKEAEPADIVVVVTCSVTSAADAKTRKIIRRTRRENPDSVLVACGCWAQSASLRDAEFAGVDILVGNRVKWMIADAVEKWYASPGRAMAEKIDVAECREWDKLSLDRVRMGTRAFIKVQDGCDRGCSYCLVSSLRGPCVSRDFDDAISEVSRVSGRGAGEIVLTGVQLGSYGHKGLTLAGLIRRISLIPGVRRLRLGSIEPFSVTEELLRAAGDSEVFCPHLHIPLQSGDDGVLRAMGRGYDSSDFARVAEMARKYLGGDVHISTDLIVGFPGESEAAFENSLSLLESLSIGKVHVFPYSPRAGTHSASMGRLPGAAIKQRAERANAVAEKLLSNYASEMVGKRDSMLAENVDGGIASGWSRHYLRVYARNRDTKNDLKGNEFIVSPKISIGSILLCEGVGREDIIIYRDE